MQSSRAVITGVGSALPARRVSNDELPKHLDTNDIWIRERTGICYRHLADDTETTGTLALEAARRALAHANLSANEIDLIIVSTSTPDLTMPSTACLVQGELGNTRAAAFDLNAACSGFVYGLNVANAMLQNGQATRALVIGAETMSRIVDWEDRSTCVLFGDGAGAVVLEARADSAYGILACRMQSDGAQQALLCTSGGISRTQQAGHLHMEGKEVFRHAVDKMGGGLEMLLKDADIAFEDVRWVIPHQANARIIQAIAKKTGLSQDRFIMTLDRHANTSAASIPLALAVAVEENRLSDGDILALPALGAGLTWGACIIKWMQHS